MAFIAVTDSKAKVKFKRSEWKWNGGILRVSLILISMYVCLCCSTGRDSRAKHMKQYSVIVLDLSTGHALFFLFPKPCGQRATHGGFSHILVCMCQNNLECHFMILGDWKPKKSLFLNSGNCKFIFLSGIPFLIFSCFLWLSSSLSTNLQIFC